MGAKPKVPPMTDATYINAIYWNDDMRMVIGARSLFRPWSRLRCVLIWLNMGY